MNEYWENLPEDLKDNPFFHFSEETHFAPAWYKIKPEHIVPAMDYALEIAQQNVEAIKGNKRKANFANTAEALEVGFELANYVYGILFSLIPRNEEEETALFPAYDKASQDYCKYFDSIFVDEDLHSRFKQARENVNIKKLPRERQFLFEMYEDTFVQSGIALSPAKQKKFKKLTDRIQELELKSMKNIDKGIEKFVCYVKRKKELAGLSDFAITAAKEKARDLGKPRQWAFTLDEDSYNGIMQYSDNRDLRRKMWEGNALATVRGRYDNRAVVEEIAQLRQKKARLFGYKTAAESVIQYNMARTPQAVDKFLRSLKKAALPRAKEELKALEACAFEQDGLEEIEPWDTAYYAEIIKKNLLGFDDEELRSYFELEAVLGGAFDHLEKLFGIHFEETDDYPGYHEDVRGFEVTKASTGEHMGVLYLDLCARDYKTSAASWHAEVMSRGLFMGEVRQPIAVIITQFTKGKGRQPTLLQHDDVLTLFHELGHHTHAIMSKCRYPSMTGVATVPDFLEFPSQLNENWAFEPEVLDSFARHYKTGETIPDEVKDQLKQLRKFMSGRQVMKDTRYGWLDLALMRARPSSLKDIEAFEAHTLKGFAAVNDNDRSLTSQFNSIMGIGYEGSYYGYQWAEILDADVFAMFQEQGLYNRSIASRLKKIYGLGGTEDYAKMYRMVRHRNPTPKAYLERQGLLSKGFNYAAEDMIDDSDKRSLKHKRRATSPIHHAHAPKMT